jgi:hypothetical protein
MVLSAPVSLLMLAAPGLISPYSVAGAVAQDASVQEAAVTVGVVIDGPWERNESVLALFVAEIEAP